MMVVRSIATGGRGGIVSDNGTNLPRCQGIKSDGTRCERVIGVSQTHCYSHDVTRAQERSKNASTAAKSKLSTEIVAIRTEIREIMSDIRSKRLTRADGAVLLQGCGLLLKAVNEGRTQTHFDELRGQIEELEAMYAKQERRASWRG
jgi:uncharacterized NAD(P)/FAD-binding protein YdhS